MTEPPVEKCSAYTRLAALRLLVEWDRSKYVFIDSIVHDFFARERLAPADAGLLASICYGVIRHRNTIKLLSAHYVHSGLDQYPRPLRMALAMGLYQLVYLGTPSHAAVDQTVAMWEEYAAGLDEHPDRNRRERGFLNGCLRAVARELGRADTAADVVDEAPDTVHVGDGWMKIAALALPSRHKNVFEMLGFKYSHPPEMVRLWIERWGEARTVEFMMHNNRPPTTGLVLRRGSVDLYLRRLESAGHAGVAGEVPGTVRLTKGANIMQLPGYAEGDFWVQDPTSARLARMLPAREGASLLDLCAAPGGKLASVLARGGPREVLACDVNMKKLRVLAENLGRLTFEGVRIDTMEVPDDPTNLRLPRAFDQILVDAPCSNTGVLARRHEARWRLLPETYRKLQRMQMLLLRAAARHLERGGDLLYITCSVEPAENSTLVSDFLRTTPELRLVQEAEHLPSASGDGGYGALLRRG